MVIVAFNHFPQSDCSIEILLKSVAALSKNGPLLFQVFFFSELISCILHCPDIQCMYIYDKKSTC